MKKKKNIKKTRSGDFSTTKLFDLILFVFRENPSKKLNYKQVSKILNIKEVGVKIQIIDTMQNMVGSGLLFEERRGVFGLLEKTSNLIVTIKNTNSRGVYADINKGNEVLLIAIHRN